VRLIYTTSDIVEGREIAEYLGIVVGKAVKGVVFVRDIFAKVRDVVGGRVKSYEKELESAIEAAFNEMAEAAQKLNADAVVGIRCDLEALGEKGTLVGVVFTGTAVRLRDAEH